MTSPRNIARISGVFYLLVFVLGGISFALSGKLVVPGDPAATASKILQNQTVFQLGWSVNLAATACYVVVTALFYELFKPVDRTVSLTAAFFSLVGCTLGGISSALQGAPLAILRDAPDNVPLQSAAYALLRVNTSAVAFVFFGCYCSLIGLLAVRSGFVPKVVGVAMLIAGAGWLTFLWPPLAHALAPYNMLPGVVGEGTLTFWLLFKGISKAS